MRLLVIKFIFLFFYCSSILAQKINVYDLNTKLPIPDVSLYQNKQMDGKTDSLGQLRVGLKHGTFYCIKHLSYQVYCFRYTYNIDTIYMIPLNHEFSNFIVSGSNLTKEIARSTFSANDISKKNSGVDIPYLLTEVPNAVVTSDAGNGTGYTGIRIRGSDPSRTNITLNGIPLNDAESQQVFWVNMPDLASGISNIQVQRGVGSSSNGAAAFGSSISIESDLQSDKAGGLVGVGYGLIYPEKKGFIQYNKNRTNYNSNIIIHSGSIHGWQLNTRLSSIYSDGYVLQSQSNLESYFISAIKKNKRNTIKLIHFSGKEKTGQAWNGIPENIYNGSDTNYKNPNRIYNTFNYKNQTDNYKQDHYQIHFTLKQKSNSQLNIGLFYTRGKGFYEELRQKENIGIYNLTSDSLLLTKPWDIIVRRWLDNSFTGSVFSHMLNFSRITLYTGGGANIYNGLHYGEVIWTELSNPKLPGHQYYNGNSLKKDFSLYEKIEYRYHPKLTIWGDIQFRYIEYSTSGKNDYFRYLLTYNFSRNYFFFNPKFGLIYKINRLNLLNFYFAKSSREPVRDDIINSGNSKYPSHEILYDFEACYSNKNQFHQFEFTAYYINYNNQLVPDGSINDVGAYNRINVPKSYRAGIEFAGNYSINKYIKIYGNASLSRNIIKNFYEYSDVYLDTAPFITNQLIKINKITPLAYSPNFTGYLKIEYEHKKDQIIFICRGIARQFLDNSGNINRTIPGYFVADIAYHRTIIKKKEEDWKLSCYIYNIFNTLYLNNGYSWGWYYGGRPQQINYVFPASTTQILLKIIKQF